MVTFILDSETTIKPRNISCQFRGIQDSSLHTKNAHCLQLQWGFIIQLQSCIKGCVAYVPPFVASVILAVLPIYFSCSQCFGFSDMKHAVLKEAIPDLCVCVNISI